ncbi:MAG: aspartate-semialdehyde dehydrogenase [Alphaproteobacteria bacterium]|nr:aspartate-semialdehyde dehydrogenase [Alphaproteobacteria bacterium]
MTKIAIAGVQGNIGREILSFLDENGYKASDIVALESKAPLGTQVSFSEDEDLDVFNLDEFDFANTDAVIFATNDVIAKHYIPRALAKNVKVIDCSSAFFADESVPLIIAGYNNDKIMATTKGLVASPSAAVIQMLSPLLRIHEKYNIKRIVVSTYNSTSVYGKEAMDELFSQTRRIYMNSPIVDDQKVFHKQIAFNVIPQIGDFIGEETQTEWAMNAESKKVLGTDIKVHANSAIIPAFIGSAQYVNVECNNDVDVDDVRHLMKNTDGIIVFDKNTDGGYVCLTDIQGEDNIYISRLRQDSSIDNGFSFWCVADDQRACIAKNAVNILKLILSLKQH